MEEATKENPEMTGGGRAWAVAVLLGVLMATGFVVAPAANAQSPTDIDCTGNLGDPVFGSAEWDEADLNNQRCAAAGFRRSRTAQPLPLPPRRTPPRVSEPSTVIRSGRHIGGPASVGATSRRCSRIATGTRGRRGCSVLSTPRPGRTRACCSSAIRAGTPARLVRFGTGRPRRLLKPGTWRCTLRSAATASRGRSTRRISSWRLQTPRPSAGTSIPGTRAWIATVWVSWGTPVPPVLPSVPDTPIRGTT